MLAYHTVNGMWRRACLPSNNLEKEYGPDDVADRHNDGHDMPVILVPDCMQFAQDEHHLHTVEVLLCCDLLRFASLCCTRARRTRARPAPCQWRRLVGWLV